MDGVSKSQVSRLCEEIDEKVKPVLGWPSDGDWPHVRLDATYLKVRRGRRIVSAAIAVAIGVNSDGRCEGLGLDIRRWETETFWSEFLRKLARRGPHGVKLVISRRMPNIRPSDAHVADVLRLSRRSLGPPAHVESDRKRVRDREASDRPNEGRIVAGHRASHGVQTGDDRLQNLAATERAKSPAQSHQRYSARLARSDLSLAKRLRSRLKRCGAAGRWRALD